MKIFFAGIQLSDWSDFPAQAVSVNGQTVFEAVDIVRAAVKRFFHRGNDQVSLSFTVSRKFATHGEAQIFLLTHFSVLPKFGLCQIICGAPGEANPAYVFMANSVLTAIPLTFGGVSVTANYTIEAGAALEGASADVLIGDENMILRNIQAIASGAESVAVVFSQAFPPATVPIVIIAIVAKPGSGGSNIIATIRDDLVTVNGFTAELSGPTPDANYKLNWTAYGT